jgi:hydroxymethylglutaryl-CoA lyase
MMENVVIREVGLRDGLQIIGTFMSTSQKKEWIDRCVAAGVREIEACSFVPEKYIPQFRDAPEVAAHAASRPGLKSAALVPNIKGAQRALPTGVGTLVCLLSATESFSQANLRRRKADSLEELAAIVRLRDDAAARTGARVTIQAGISVAFGCPFEGRVADRDLCSLAELALRRGADEVSLADTAGQGDPGQVRRVFNELRQSLGTKMLAAHFHDTRGTGLANVLAALDAGVRSFDASISGLGGCPNSPGATGNVATEDLVCMLESMGLDTGIDLQRLLDIRKFVADCLPGVRMFGHIGQVGAPKGFVPARAAVVQS